MAMTQLDAVVRVVLEVLGEQLVGIYLHGSTARDGMRPHSDLDVLVVSAARLSEAQRADLVRGLLAISGRWGDAETRPIELTVVAQPEVRPWRYAPRMELQYGEWLRAAFQRGEIPPAEANPDLAPLLTMARQANRPVFGPPATVVLDEVPAADLRRAIVGEIPGMLMDFPNDTTNYLLTLARVWVTIATGEIVGKDEGAAWTLERLPVELRAPLARALAAYEGEVGYGGWEGAELDAARATADAIVGAIEALNRGA
jgi:streptomycin 3"-adenylyltransferase